MNEAIVTAALPFGAFFKTPPAPTTPATLGPQNADPVADGCIAIDRGNLNPYNFMMFLFFGVGTAGQTFGARIIGWKLLGIGGSACWIPMTLADVTCTLTSTSGPTGGTSPLTPTSLLATIVVNSSIPSYDLWPASNGGQVLRLDLSGMQRVGIAPGSGNATSLNAMGSGF